MRQRDWWLVSAQTPKDGVLHFDRLTCACVRCTYNLRKYKQAVQRTSTGSPVPASGAGSAALDQRVGYAQRTGCHARRSAAWRPAVRQASGSGDPDAAGAAGDVERLV